MKRQKLKIGVDVDDVLYDCNQHAVDLLCSEREYSPMSIYDIEGWGAAGGRLDERLAYFSRADFVENQPILPGAQEFIEELSKRGEVFFSTAVGGKCMSARAQRLIRDFPQVPERNIMIGARKDLLSLDILLDDGAHNILGSSAKYPVLFRRPWNNHLTGLLAVNGYGDFLRLVDQIAGPAPGKGCDLQQGGIICLIGPSGSNKTLVTKELLKNPRFAKPVTTTTRPMRRGEEGTYHFISRGEFQRRQEQGAFLETTVYGGEYYGAAHAEIDSILKQGRIALMPVDICGGISLKNAYPHQTMLLFLRRPRGKVLEDILQKECPQQEKVLRILSLDSEYRNEDICDETLFMGEDPARAAAELLQMLEPDC